MYLSLASADPEFLNAALAELRAADPKIKHERNLSPSIALVASSLDFNALSSLVIAQEPIFLRHLAPATRQIVLSNLESDLPFFVQTAAELEAPPVPFTFAVQVRFNDKPEERPYSPFAVKSAIAGQIIQKYKAEENIKQPEWVYSICCTPDTAYIGLSEVSQNLSDWAGGERRFAREDGQISRAEFKLLEAFEVFGLSLPEEGIALDLGAAPGGWSRVLLQNNFAVMAVDPATLDPRVTLNPDLEHFQGHADKFLALAKAKGYQFDLIVNDMRLDARQAADFMVLFAPLLKPQGYAISSLKLPHATAKLKPVTLVRQALEIMRKAYPYLRARQLFHNRQEVTVLMSKHPL
jgi:23S rRNA (cytidine2498-2'-O)-methyltransferase